MNPVYSIQESPHRWLIWAGIAFLVATFGAMFMLAYHVPHPVERAWLAVFLIAALVCLVLALRQWKREVDAALTPEREQ